MGFERSSVERLILYRYLEGKGMTQEGPWDTRMDPQESIHQRTQRGPGSSQHLCTCRHFPELVILRNIEVLREIK